MADQLTLEVVTPERIFVSEQVDEAQLPGKEGYMGILPGHAPLISELANGVLSYTSGGSTKFIAIYGGFVEVIDNRIKLLADSAERKEEIDVAKAREELQKAYQTLEEPPVDLDPASALAAVMRAQARVDAAQK